MQDNDPYVPVPAIGADFGGRSARTIYRWIKKGILPRPITISGRNYLRQSQVDDTRRRLDEAARCEAS